MRLTRFTEYSLRVLIYLGQNNESRVTISQISEDYDISKNHLMKVVSNLTRLQFVVAQRGPGGGIQLNRLPKDINLGEVVANTEKHFKLTQQTDSSEDSADARLNSYLQLALNTYLEALGRYTLADVLGSEFDAAELLALNGKAA